MSPVVEQALEAIQMRVNVSTGLSHPLDRAAATEMFSILQGADEDLESIEISRWAAEHGWKTEHAVELGELARKVESGTARGKGSSKWAPDILDQLRASARKPD